MRFSRFLPIHILCLALVLSGLPPACRASAADGERSGVPCWPGRWHSGCLPHKSGHEHAGRHVPLPSCTHLSRLSPLSPTPPIIGCLPDGVHRAAVAALLAIGGLLPATALYYAEGQARRRFLAASSHLCGQQLHPQGAAME